MNAALHHRGPDEGGVVSLGFAALGMRRLSIVDLSRGSQPMSTEDGRTTLVYNGEIYDCEEHRERLRAEGHRFRTHSDTEVLLRSWAAEGPACLNRLGGMFAFAVADREERCLHLARDRVGIKPLYYARTDGGGLIFSSELASLLSHPGIERRLDRRSLAMLLVDRCVNDPWTLVEGVRQLPPGHVLRWKAGRFEIRRWAEPPLPAPAEGAREGDEESALSELVGLLDESVRSHLVADVPVGVFLSGGIDSSTVAAFAARALRERGEAVQSFSVGFAHPDYDESALAREVARHLSCEHHELRVEEARFDADLLDLILDHAGQPLGDTSCIPTLLVSRLAREHVKVALSGDGGDELFGGYDHVRWAGRVRRAERIPAPLRRLGQAVLAGAAPLARGRLAERARRGRKGLALSFREPADQLRRMMSLWVPEELPRLLNLSASELELRPALAGGELDPAGREPEEYAMAWLARTYMPAAILTKVDRMSMAASLEVRVPLLDRRVLDFADRLPLGLKMRDGIGKYLLRRAGREMLPESVYTHRKRGFSIPLCDWLNDEFWELLRDLYAPGARAAALFRREALEEVMAEGRSARADEGRLSHRAAASRVWLLAMLGRWMERWEVAA